MSEFRRKLYNITGTFEKVYYYVTFTSIYCTISGATSGSYRAGTKLTITAVPNYGCRFLRWNDGETAATRTIIVNSNMYLQAIGEQSYVTNLLPIVNLTNYTPVNTNYQSENNLGWDGAVYGVNTAPGVEIGFANSVVEAFYYSVNTIHLNPTHTYYIRVHLIHNCTSSKNINYDVYWPVAEPVAMQTTYPKDTGWHKYSKIITRASFTEGDYNFRVDVNNRSLAAHANFSCPMLIDLTETYGTSIPTLAQLDSKPYFSGTKLLSEWS